jgi:integrase
MRREELVQLKVCNIDSARMLIHIEQGKGNRDRDVMLSPRLLEELRGYWRSANPKPKTYLFPGGGRAHASDVPMCAKSVFHAVKNAAARAGIRKRVHPHNYRPILHDASERLPEVCARHSNCTRRRNFPDCLPRFMVVICELQPLFAGDASSVLSTTSRQPNCQKRCRQFQYIQNP